MSPVPHLSRINLNAALTLLCSMAIGCASTSSSQPKAMVEVFTKALKETPELNQMRLEIPWELENPTGSVATVDAMKWTFEIDGQAPINGVEEMGLSSNPKTTDSYTTELTVPLKNGEQALHSENQNDLWKYRLSATFQIKTASGLEEIEAQWHGELFPPQPPKMSIYAEGARYSSGSYELNFYVTVENPNSFTFKLDEVQYKLKVDGTQILHGILGSNRTMGPGVGLEFEMSKTIGKRDFADLAKRLRGRTNIPYLFDSNVSAAGLKFANPIEATINFER